MTLRWAVVVLCAVGGCKSKAPPPAPMTAVRVQKLEPLERVLGDAGEDPREALYRVAPFEPVAPPPPPGAQVVELDLERATSNGAPFNPGPGEPPVLLVVKGETYLAQAAPLLSKLDDAKREVWLKHPDAAQAFKLTLRDEPAFRQWLDEASDSGHVRVIHREDGFELQTSLGKLPGPDPNGPSVPVRGGKMDLATLQRGLAKVQSRFKTAGEYCVVPSFGMPLNDVARGLAANFLRPDSSYFPLTCLVYPRPAQATP